MLPLPTGTGLVPVQREPLSVSSVSGLLVRLVFSGQNEEAPWISVVGLLCG